MFESIMSEEVDMDYENEEECGVNEPHVDCSDACLTAERMFCGELDPLLMKMDLWLSDTNTSSRGRTSFVLIGCERSGEYRCRKKEFIRRDTGTRKYGCPFELRGKPVVGGQGWMVKLMCEIHNHELAKSLVGHPYTLIANMKKSMVKPKNILLTLKEHNVNSCTTIKQIYNARSAYRSSIRGSDTKMQYLIKFLERDQYIHWHRLKDEDMVRDIFWCHPNAVKLVNTCNLVFLIDSTYKTNRYKLPLLDFVGVTQTGMTFSASFAYLEGEHLNNVNASEVYFQDVMPSLKDQTLMNAVKTVFPKCTNLLCSFHIKRNVKAKCKSLIGQRNAWEYVMDAWGTLVDCPSEQQFDEWLKKFEMVWSPWSMFVDYVKDTWIIPHKEKFVIVLTNKVMHLGNTTTNRVESTHWALKRVLQNSFGDSCSVWDAMNNMMTLQHTKIKASFETSTHVVEHVFKKTLYKRLLGMVSRYALNHIAAQFERVHYAGKNSSSCGCVMKSTHGLPCACELSKYVVGCIPLDSIHMFWRRLSFLDQGLFEPEVSIKEEMETISKIFEELEVCGKFTLKTKLREIAYPDQNLMCPPLAKVNTKGAPKKPMNRNPRSTKRDPSYWEYVDAFDSMQNSNSSVRHSASSSEQPNPRTIMPMLDQFQPFIHNFIHNIVDFKANGNCGYWSIAGLSGMGEDSWSWVHTHLLKELGKFSDEYMKLFGGKERFEELRMSLLVDGLTKVTMDKWMDITDMGYVYLKDRCPLPSVALLWSSNCHPQAKQWPTPYISRMQHYKSFMMIKRDYYPFEYLTVVIFKHTGNHVRFQCMQLKNDDDVNTITPDDILNLLETTMTPMHDVLLYYNGKWNMPRKNEFVGYSFTGKNPKKFDIPSRCTMDELKDLIKQVAPHGISPYGIHETQMINHHEYSDKIIKFKIIELKTNNDVLKVLVQPNY
ncbi:Protein FAR1-RELATED SEQUENCE 5 [Glycine soja]